MTRQADHDAIRDQANADTTALYNDPAYRASQHTRCLALIAESRPRLEELRATLARLKDNTLMLHVVEIQSRLRVIHEALTTENWS